MRIRGIITAILVLLTLPLGAQSRQALRGRVQARTEAGVAPLEGAVVQLKPSGLYSICNSKGEYIFDKLDNGRCEVSVQMIGYVTKDTVVVVGKGGRQVFDFVLEEENFRLSEVTVVAEASKAGDATASMISRQAIDHSQTSSLGDIMQLLPGSSISNPNLSSAKSLNLRTAGTSSMNSLGTAVIMDGAPMSNNANMEGFTAAMTGVSSTVGSTSTTQSGSVPNSGYDVRSISTDNIESVEIIRGIPSVQYGDLTSGAVIINSKAGVEPLTIRLKTDPKIYQAAVSKGFRLGDNKGSMNISGDYAYSNAKTTEAYANYQRLNVKALYSKTFNTLSTTTSLEAKLGRDIRQPNPDDFRTMLSTGGTNIGYRFNTTGTWSANKGWFKTLNYNISNSYTYKESFKEQLCSGAMAIYSTNMESGSTVSNTPGQHLFDTNGNEITNFTEGNTYWATFTKDSYFSHYDFYSKELNVFAKVNANFYKAWNNISNKIIVGSDFKSDGNLGDGLVFEEGAPPLRSSNSESGYRARPLYDIPFVNQFGVYAEDAFKAVIAKRELTLTAGLRYDLVNGKTALSPRTNLSYEIIPGWLAIRGGYGLTSKAPTSAYLYPNNAYYDQSHFNNGSYNENQVVIASTYIINTENPDLQLARNRKAEIGFDLTLFKKYKLAVTYYDELMQNGYNFSSAYALFPYKYYTMSGTDANGNPTFTLSRDTQKFFQYYTPSNNLWEHNTGLEYELNLGRFKAIRTSFHLNGAWMRTESSNSGYTKSLRLNSGSTVNSHVSVWDPFVSTSHYEKFINTLRATHNIPSIGFVVTLTTQVNVYTKNWTTYRNDEYPQYYISRNDGAMYEFTEQMASDSQYKYMYDVLTTGRFIVSHTRPTLVFNLNVSKEIHNFMTASFFVNNIFNSRPLDSSEVSKGSYTELNQPMYFGFELKLKL